MCQYLVQQMKHDVFVRMVDDPAANPVRPRLAPPRNYVTRIARITRITLTIRIALRPQVITHATHTRNTTQTTHTTNNTRR